MDSPTTKSPSSKWSDNGPTAPTIIPIMFFIVVGAAILCLILKYFKKIWDKKRRSDIYEIVDLIQEDGGLSPEPGNLKKGTDPTLSAIRFTDVPPPVRHFSNNHHKSQPVRQGSPQSGLDPDKDSVDADTLSNGQLQVEANIHDSSNETNESIVDVEMEEGSHNTETLPLRKKQNAPLAATESDV